MSDLHRSTSIASVAEDGCISASQNTTTTTTEKTTGRAVTAKRTAVDTARWTATSSSSCPLQGWTRESAVAREIIRMRVREKEGQGEREREPESFNTLV